MAAVRVIRVAVALSPLLASSASATSLICCSNATAADGPIDGTFCGEDACDGRCKGADKLVEGAYWNCSKEVESPNGFVLTTDYKSCQEHTTGIVTPITYVWGRTTLALLLMAFLLFLFLGVAVVADQFMVAIEVITSKEKKIWRTDIATGEKVQVSLKFWNPTVANLSLLALGSSAPEILLAVIETVSNLGGPAGELGPSTIVGSAAFNLLVISAVCIISVPAGEVRTVTQIKVFMCTSVWSLFAYIWLLIVLDMWTPDEVTMIEAILTFVFFPTLLVSSYYIDKYETRMSSEAAHQADDSTGGWIGGKDAKETQALRVMNSHGEVLTNRNEISAVLQSAGGNSQDAAKALMKLIPPPPISRMQARINAAKAMTGKRYLASADVEAHDAHDSAPPSPNSGGPSPRSASDNGMHKVRGGAKNGGVKISFETPTIIGKESTKLLTCKIVLSQSSPTPVTVEYRTENGTAEAGKDYVKSTGTVTFKPGSTTEEIQVTLIEDDEFEPDETFTIHLHNPSANAKLGLSVALCLIVDDHEPGQLGFAQRFQTVKESEDFAIIPVQRTYGANGRVTVDYSTSDGVAKAGENYDAAQGTLVFEAGETEKELKIKIILDVEPEQNMNFCIMLSNPDGGASLGKCNMAVVTILDDSDIEEVTDLVASMLAQRDAMRAGENPGSFRQQFVEALECQGGVDHLGQSIDPTPTQMVMHSLSLFWKLLFATIPPVDYCSGWATFSVALIYIGIITAIVGDVAAQFGCAIGLEDSVTAISIVALGTSLPDLFASKQAVVDGTDADAAVGNVTGSNSVNVFLGLGVPWLIAAVYYNVINDQKFCVPAGALNFSVMVFTATAIFCLSLIFYRRRFSGGELGGAMATRWFHFTLLVGCWVMYLSLSTLQAYGHVGPTIGASRCTP